MKVFISGGSGLVGKGLVQVLRRNPAHTVISPTHVDLDLLDKTITRSTIAALKPDVIIHAAARVGGIEANQKYPYEFLHDNLVMSLNILEAAKTAAIPKFIFLGSSCTYPKHASQPIAETDLLTGALEPTNEPFAIAKIAAIQMCKAIREQYDFDYTSIIPTAIYGLGDSTLPHRSHVLAATIAKVVEAKKLGKPNIEMWGTGTPQRELLHTSDLAKAIQILIDQSNKPAVINIGSGEELSIKELVTEVANACQYKGTITWNTNKPDGMQRKLLNSSYIRSLGWRPSKTVITEIPKLVSYFMEHNNLLE